MGTAMKRGFESFMNGTKMEGKWINNRVPLLKSIKK
jgi:hypothetical protein